MPIGFYLPESFLMTDEHEVCAGPKITFITTRWDLYWGLIFGIPSTRGVLILWPAIWLWRTYVNVKDVLASPDLGFSFKLWVFVRYAVAEGVWLGFVLIAVYALMTMVTRKGGIVCEHTLTLGDTGIEEATHVNRQWRSYREFKTMRRTAGFWLVRGISSTHFVFRDSGVRDGNPSAFSVALNNKIIQ